MTDFPQGASRGVGHTILMCLLHMPFQDRAELTEWLLGAEAGRPRTDSEMKAYTDGWLMAVRTATEKGLEKARQEAMLMARMEWPERFDEEGNLKPT